MSAFCPHTSENNMVKPEHSPCSVRPGRTRCWAPPIPAYIFLFVIYLTVTILTEDKCRHLNMIGSFHGRYSNYVFISDQAIAQSAGMNSRYTDSSLHGVVFDIHMLSVCDFLVCTFSSQVSGNRKLENYSLYDIQCVNVMLMWIC